MTVIVPKTEHNSKPINPYKTGFRLAILAGFIIIILFLRDTKPAFLCGADKAGKDSNVWQITESNIDATILWQKSDLSNLRTTGQGNGKLAVSDNLVLFARGPSQEFCQWGDDLVALNTSDGSLRWKFSASLLHSIQRVDDNFLVLFGDTEVALLEENGTPRWLYENLPSRSARSVYKSGENFYLPSGSNTYVLSTTGERLRTMQDSVVLGGFNEFLIIREGNLKARLIDLESRQEIQSITFSSDIAMSFHNVSFGFTGDILLIFYGSDTAYRIEAYQIQTNELLWRMDENSFSLPVVIKNHLVIYTQDHHLKFYKIATGEMSAQMTLQRNKNHEWYGFEYHVLLGAYNDTLAILYPYNGELLTLRFDLD